MNVPCKQQQFGMLYQPTLNWKNVSLQLTLGQEDKPKVNRVHSIRNKCKWTNQTLEKSMDVVKDGHVHWGNQISYGTYYH